MDKAEDFLNKKFALISIVGPHAGESKYGIFVRKKNDIDKAGRTYWVINSPKAKPSEVHRLGKQAEDSNDSAIIFFVEPSTKGGAKDTANDAQAGEYLANVRRDENSKNWEKLPAGLTPVTGKMDKGAYALVLSGLISTNIEINLWGYADFSDPNEPIKMTLGRSTFCAINKDTSKHPNKMKSNIRKVGFIGVLTAPYSVWIRK